MQTFPCPITQGVGNIRREAITTLCFPPKSHARPVSRMFRRKILSFSSGLIKIYVISGHCFYRTILIIYIAVSLSAESKLEHLKRVSLSVETMLAIEVFKKHL